MIFCDTTISARFSQGCKLSDTNNDLPIVDTVVDARGLKCPEPVMMFRNSLRRAEHKEQVKLIATDPSTCRDVPTMCKFLGYKIVHHEIIGEEYHFVVSAGPLN